MSTALHLVIPFAHASTEACAQALRDLRLPHLSALAARWLPDQRDDGDDFALSMPHERALARAWGWNTATGAIPFAAMAAHADGIDTGDMAWGLLTPSHWHVGREHITLLEPDSLNLSDFESRGLFDGVRSLFESEGMAVFYGAPLRWYVAHESLRELPCAGLDRAMGRNVDAWLPSGPPARLIRRLQSEVQMLLYQHPLNDAREARGERAVNSFWLSGCGRYQAPAHETSVQLIDTLRTPALQQDWAAWADAWQALDAQVLASLHDRDEITLTLCGERSSQSLIAHRVSTLRSWGLSLRARWQVPSVHSLLGTL
jgi:hypothetical protein